MDDKIKQIALEVFTEQFGQTQFNVSAVPYHVHNQTDSPRIPPTSILNFIPLPANNLSTSDLSGVLSTNNIGVSTPPYGIVYPVPIINGYGVGAFSAFNGGNAPYGSMIGFQNGNTVNQLWIMMTDNLGNPQWRGIDLNLTA